MDDTFFPVDAFFDAGWERVTEVIYYENNRVREISLIWTKNGMLARGSGPTRAAAEDALLAVLHKVDELLANADKPPPRDPKYIPFCDWLRLECRRRRIYQSDIAEKLAVKKGEVGKLFHGRLSLAHFNPGNVLVLAYMLDMTPEALLQVERDCGKDSKDVHPKSG